MADGSCFIVIVITIFFFKLLITITVYILLLHQQFSYHPKAQAHGFTKHFATAATSQPC